MGLFTLTSPSGSVSSATAFVVVPTPIPTVPTGIFDYGSLLTAVALWMNRTDLGGQMDSVLGLVEAKVRRTLRDRTVGPVSFVLIDGASLPDDCGELRTMRLADTRFGNIPISISSLTAIAARQQLTFPRPGVPESISIVEKQVYVAPLLDGAYNTKITYYQTVPPLTAINPTNWLLTQAPDVYLYGMLSEFSAFNVEDARAALWMTAFQTAMMDMERARERREYASTPLTQTNEWTF